MAFMIVIDIETTGLQKEIHAIASIGAVDFKNPSRQFYKECQIPQEAKITEFAMSWNGFNEKNLRDPKKIDTRSLLFDLMDWFSPIKDQTLAGENIRWDRDFIQYNIDKYKVPFKISYLNCDLNTISYDFLEKKGFPIPMKNNASGLSLDETLQFVGLYAEPKPHHGLTGARMEAEAFSRFRYKKSLLPEFEKYPIPDYL